jgi:ribosome biogenesis GTPase
MADVSGRVISLDRGFPLVKTSDGEVRAQHSIELVKNLDMRAVVGDVVDLESPPGQDTPLITAIHPRGHTLVRRSLVESRHEGAGKHEEQVLAANVDIVFVVCALSNRRVDTAYLERQLVMAHESGAEVAVILTKADLARHLDEDIARVRACAFDSPVIVSSAKTGEGLLRIRELLGEGRIGVLLGRSGVGKSTLINELLGAPLLETGTVRKKDRAGRHTTVARKMVFLEGGSAGGCGCEQGSEQGSEHGREQGSEHGREQGSEQGREQKRERKQPYGRVSALVDTPGLRSIGLYDAYEGLAAAFPDIVEHAAHCRYRDCTHTGEPDCAVATAVAEGALPASRLASYTTIAAEVDS